MKWLFLVFIFLSACGVKGRIPKEHRYLSIVTVRPGSTPVEIENFITKPIEMDLANIAGIKSIHSYSIKDSSIVVIELEARVDCYEVRHQVVDQMELTVKNLPADIAWEPVVIAAKLK